MASKQAQPQAPRETRYVRLGDLQPDPRNPKAHDVELIDTSIGRFGIIDQIAVDGRTGYVISGHGRVKALTSMWELRRRTSGSDKVKKEPGLHLCMAMRGVKTPASMTTSVTRGVFREGGSARAEWLALMDSTH